jgi:acetyl esterase/lipase
MIKFPHSKHLLGEEASDALRIELSNERQVTSETPPAFMWITADDAKVPVQHNLLFATAIAAHQVPFELHIFESGRHGLGVAKDHPSVRYWTELCKVWLAKHEWIGLE